MAARFIIEKMKLLQNFFTTRFFTRDERQQNNLIQSTLMKKAKKMLYQKFLFKFLSTF